MLLTIKVTEDGEFIYASHFMGPDLRPSGTLRLHDTEWPTYLAALCTTAGTKGHFREVVVEDERVDVAAVAKLNRALEREVGRRERISPALKRIVEDMGDDRG